MAEKEKASLYEPAEIIAAAETFGTTPEIMTGALHGVKEPITKDAAKKLLEAFKKKPITR